MVTVNFKAVHRLLLRSLIDEEAKAGFSLSEQSKRMKIQDKLLFTEDESKLLNFRLQPTGRKDKDGNDTMSMVWDPKNAEGVELDVLKPIELSDEQVDIIKGIF